MQTPDDEFLVVLEEHPEDDGSNGERTIATIEDGEVHINYQHFIDGEWKMWHDMGANLSIANFMMLAGLIENRDKIKEAADMIDAVMKGN